MYLGYYILNVELSVCVVRPSLRFSLLIFFQKEKIYNFGGQKEPGKILKIGAHKEAMVAKKSLK